MEKYFCPYCNTIIPEHDTTHHNEFVYFFGKTTHGLPPQRHNTTSDQGATETHIYHCTQCGNYSVFAYRFCSREKFKVPIEPQSICKHFPDYIPAQIVQDYQEASAIKELSPKASATLSRRCLQGMIRDKWKVTKKSLYEEINELKPIIDPTVWASIDALRQLGNIGAHMEKDVGLIIDVDPQEADKLVRLIEVLIDEWYVQPHDRDVLLNDIVQINQQKQDERKA